MEQKATYSAGFKEQALSKVLSRGKRTIQSVADELNMNVFTLKNWMKRALAGNRLSSFTVCEQPLGEIYWQRPSVCRKSQA